MAKKDRGIRKKPPSPKKTYLRPDMVIWSEEKRIILIELTVLWEDRCEEASERKAI